MKYLFDGHEYSLTSLPLDFYVLRDNAMDTIAVIQVTEIADLQTIHIYIVPNLPSKGPLTNSGTIKHTYKAAAMWIVQSASI